MLEDRRVCLEAISMCCGAIGTGFCAKITCLENKGTRSGAIVTCYEAIYMILHIILTC